VKYLLKSSCAAAVGLISCGVALAAAPSATMSVTITYVDCPQNINLDSQPTITVFGKHDLLVTRDSLPRLSARSIREITITLPPGFYGISVVNADCSDEVLLALLPGHPRHVVALGKKEALLRTYRTMMAGTLPFEGAQVAIVYVGRTATQGQIASPDGYVEIPAVVEGDAYYAVGLPTGNVTIRLYNQGRYRWLDFEGGRIGPPEGSAYLVRDITARDVSNKLNTLVNKRATCVPARAPGVTVCTPPT
jgi:hypothetical protein